MSTFNAEDRNIQNVTAIINGKLNIEGLSYAFRQKTFSFYIKRFVAEKSNADFNEMTDEDINNVTFKETKTFIEKILANYPTETKENITEIYSQSFKRALRKAFSYEDDCMVNKVAYEKLVNNPTDYNEYKSLSNNNHKTSDEKKRFSELTKQYGFVEKRKFTRKNLLDLFFLLNCNVDEAIDLFHRLGEQSFYSKDRNEMLIWWALKEDNNKYGKYLELVEKGLLETQQVAINFAGMSTGDFSTEFLKCKTDFEFEHVLCKLKASPGNRESRRKLYFNIIKDIDKIFNSYFITKSSNKRIKAWNKQIEKYSEQLFVDGITKREQTTAYNAIATREGYISKENKELYDKVVNKPAVSILNTRFSEFMEKENLQNATEMIRINNIKKNENAKITRNDIIVAYFIKTVLENYYNSYDLDTDSFDSNKIDDDDNLVGQALFNSKHIKELSDEELIDIINKFQNNLDGLLIKNDYMPLNYMNEIESYLIICLASRNPLKYFCRIVSTFELFDYETV